MPQDASAHARITPSPVENADAEDFVEPTPAPIDTSDPHTVIMMAALVLGPLWLCYLLFFDRDASLLWWALAALTATGGFVMAVLRQPRTRADDDDDGARV